MILDTIKNASAYEGMHKNFKAAFDYIRKTDLTSLEEGRIDLDGDDLYAMVQIYETKSKTEKSFETHQNYIDIQYIISGEEMVGYTPFENITVKIPYNPEKDIAFFNHKEAMTECVFKAGSFAIFFPRDPHMPCCTIADGKASSVRKLIFKVKV